MKRFGRISELFKLLFRDPTSNEEISIVPSSTASYAGSTEVELPPSAATSQVLVEETATQTLENKTMDFSTGGNNSLTADAVDVIFDPGLTGLSSTDVNTAIQEVEGNAQQGISDAADVAQDLSDHLSDTTDAHDASAISFAAGMSGLVSTDANAAILEVEANAQQGISDAADVAQDLSDHLSDTTDAHDASAISFAAGMSGLVATDVNAAILEVEGNAQQGISDASDVAQDLSDHLSDTTDAHDASAISFSNIASGLTATDAQAAIDEVEGRLEDVEDLIGGNASGDVLTTDDTQSVSGKTFTDDVQFTSTGAIKVPVGDISERPSPLRGYVRFNDELNQFEGYDGSTWGPFGGGGSGSGGINYVLNPDAESGVDGWTTYAESRAVTFQDTGDTVTFAGHGLAAGDLVSFTSITSTTGISTNVLYYVVSPTTNTFQVASSAGGSALPLTTNGSGTMVQGKPVAGTGGTPSVTWTRNVTTPLRGAGDFRLDKTTTNEMGQGVAYAFEIDLADRNRLLTISADFSCPDADYVAGDLRIYVLDVTAGTLIVPSQITVPGGSGRFEALFTATTSTSYRLLIHVAEVGTSAWNVHFDDFRVGPDQAVFGPSVGEWEDSGSTITFTNRAGGSLDFTRSAENILHMRSGSNLNARGYLVSSSAGTGVTTADIIALTLAGLSVDYSRLPDSGSGENAANVVGHGVWDDGGVEKDLQLTMDVSGNTIIFFENGANRQLREGDIASGDRISFSITNLPIAQWAGDVTHLAAARVEYAYNTVTFATDAADTTSFGYGPAGVAFSSNDLTGRRVRRVRFQTPIQPSDKIELEIYTNGTWVPASNVMTATNYPMLHLNFGSNSNNGSFGVACQPVSGSTTDIDVTWGRYGNWVYSTSTGTGWSSVVSTSERWRVRKSSPHAPAGVQLATSSTPGLMPVYEEGTYSPTITNVAGFTGAITSSQATYLRIGTKVFVSGYFICANVTSATFGQAGISLPVASNFAANTDCSGTSCITQASVPYTNGGYVEADSTNNRAELRIHNGSGSGSTHELSYSFSYTII